MSDILQDVIETAFDIMAFGIGLFFLLRSVSMMNQLLSSFQALAGGM